MNDFKIVLKRKSIPMLVEFCLDENIEFIVKPQAFPNTDWEFTLKIVEIKTAVVAGMFLRENKIDIAGVDPQKIKKAAAPVAKKSAVKEEEEKEEVETPAVEEEKGLF